MTSACLHVRVFCFRNFSLTPEFLHLKCTGNHQSWLTLRPQGLWPAGLLCPWGSPGKNPGVDGHFLLQGNFPTQGLNLGPLHCRQILYRLSHRKPQVDCSFPKQRLKRSHCERGKHGPPRLPPWCRGPGQSPSAQLLPGQTCCSMESNEAHC